MKTWDTSPRLVFAAILWSIFAWLPPVQLSAQDQISAKTSAAIFATWSRVEKAMSRYDFERAKIELETLETCGDAGLQRRARLIRAELLYRDVQVESAFTIWNELMQQSPHDASLSKQIATFLAGQKDWVAALPIIRTWNELATGDDVWEAKLLLGRAIEEIEPTWVAINHYSKLLAEVPANSWFERETVWRLASLHDERLSTQELYTCFEELRIQLPGRPSLVNAMTLAFFDIDQPRAAIRFCQQAVNEQPADLGVHRLLLNHLLALDFLDDAERHIATMQQRFPDEISPTLLLADIYAHQKRMEDYRRVMQDYTNRQQGNLQALQQIARIHRAYDQNDIALEVLVRSVAEHPDSFDAITYHARWAKADGQDELARQSWERANAVAIGSQRSTLARDLWQAGEVELLTQWFGPESSFDGMSDDEFNGVAGYLVDAYCQLHQPQLAISTLIRRLGTTRNHEQLRNCWRQASRLHDDLQVGPPLFNALQDAAVKMPICKLLQIELVARDGDYDAAYLAAQRLAAEVETEDKHVAAMIDWQLARLARGVNDWDTTSRLTAKLYELAVPGLSPTPSEVVHDYLLGEQPNAALQFIQDWKKRDPADWRAWQEEVNCLLLMGERPQANLRRLEAILRFSDISTVGNKFLTLDSDMTFSRSPSDDLESIESNPELDLAMQIAGESIPPAYKGKLLQILLSSESTRDGVPYERTKIVEYIESLAAKDPADFLPPLLLGHLDRERAGGNWFRRARRIAPELSETNLGIFLQRKSENSSSASIVYAGYQRFQMQQNHAADGLAWAEQLSWPQIRRAVADTDKPSNSQLMLYFRKHPRITADPLEVSHETRDYLVRIASSHEALVPARLAQACLEVIASDGASNPRNTDLWLELLRGDRAGSIPRRYHDRRLLLPIQFGFTEFWPNSFANKALRDDYLNRSGVHWIMPGWNSDDHNIGLRQTALTQLIKNFAAPTTRQLLYDLQQCGIPDAAGLVKRTRSLFGDNSMHANESDDSPDSALAVVARQLEAKKVAGTEATDNTLRESHLALEKSNPDAALWLAMVLAKTDPAFATLVAAELEKRDQTGAPDPQVLEWYDPNPYYGQMFRPNETPLTPLDRIMERWLWKWYEADTSRIPSVVNKLGELYGWHWDEFIDSESLLLFLEREMTLFENETPLKIHRRRRYFDSPWRHFMTLPDTPAASLHLPRSIANMNDYTDIPSSGMNDWPEREMVLQRQAYMEKNFNRFQNPRLRLYAAQLLYRGHTSRGIADGFSLNDLKTAVAAGLEHDPNWATARMLAATIALHEKRWEEACRLLELALETNLSGEDRWMIDHTLVKLALERESAESWESSEPVDQAARRALRRILRYPLDRDNILPVAAQMTTLGCHDLVQRLFRVHRVSRWSRDNQVELRVNRSAPTSLSSTNQNSTETRLRLLVCRTYVGLSQLEPLSGFTGGLTVKQIWLNKAEIPQLLERLDPKSYESAPSAAIRGRIAFQLGDRQLAENCFQRAMQLEPYRSEWRSQWLELNGFPEPSALGEVLQQFPPAQSVALVDLIERWMNAPQISLRDRLDMTEQLLAHLETIHGDDINATLANAMTRSLGDPLWSIYRIEQENRRLLEQMTSEAIVPTETEQRIERIHSRVPQIRIGSNMPSSR